MYQKLVISVKQFCFSKTTFFLLKPFACLCPDQPCSLFPCRGDRKGKLSPTFGLQRKRRTFDIVTKILQGPSSTLAAGFLLKRHPWTQLRETWLNRKKEKVSVQGMSSPAPCNWAQLQQPSRRGLEPCRGALLPWDGHRQWGDAADCRAACPAAGSGAPKIPPWRVSRETVLFRRLLK